MKFSDPGKLENLLVTKDMLGVCNECNCNCDPDGSCTGPCSNNCKCYEYESPQAEVQGEYAAP